MDEFPNDNGEQRDDRNRLEPDAHGQAALLLVESLIHSLVARSIISVADAIEIVEVAADVESDFAADAGEPSTNVSPSLALLNALGSSLKFDLPKD
ncbi:hypothetical protein ACFB49_33600 [Sphingomonas sp. DBB INV C78]|uniref:hypothetical protein n=1 Tax=Sphingomonas sp. DBB INV C78 TaxID=3349434 RepID=UPI0036D341A2